MKKLLPLLILLLFTAFALPASAEFTPSLVSDTAKVLTPAEERALLTELNRICQTHGLPVTVVFTNAVFTEGETEAMAREAFRELTHGSDEGMIFYVSLSVRKWNIQGIGNTYNRLNSDAMDRLVDRCVPLLEQDDFGGAAMEFAETADEILTLTANGKEFKAPLPWQQYLVGALLAGIIIAGIAVYSMAAKLKTVRPQATARSYVKENSLNLTHSRDLFLYRTLTRTPRPKSNSSSRGGSGGGSRSGSF